MDLNISKDEYHVIYAGDLCVVIDTEGPDFGVRVYRQDSADPDTYEHLVCEAEMDERKITVLQTPF